MGLVSKMSYDLSLAHICPHFVIKEKLDLDLTDRRSLHPLRPPSNDNVVLYVNKNLVEKDNPVWGYTLVKDITKLDSKKIFFQSPIRSQNDLFELSYTTTPTNCRRCGSLRIENDFYFNTLGRVVRVRDEAKLIQDVQKFIITVRGSNPFHTYIGTSIIQSIGAKLVDASFTQLTITQEIIDILDKLQRLQFQQQRVQLVTDREFLFRVVLIDVKQSEIDPTVFNIKVIAVNRAGDTAEFEQLIALPGAQDLLFGDPRNPDTKQGYQKTIDQA